jgi:hypothetical protein
VRANAAAHREPGLSAIRWSRLLSPLFGVGPSKVIEI